MTFLGYVTFEILDDELLGLAWFGERRLQPHRAVGDQQREVVPLVVLLALFAVASLSSLGRHGVGALGGTTCGFRLEAPEEAPLGLVAGFRFPVLVSDDW